MFVYIQHPSSCLLGLISLGASYLPLAMFFFHRMLSCLARIQINCKGLLKLWALRAVPQPTLTAYVLCFDWSRPCTILHNIAIYNLYLHAMYIYTRLHGEYAAEWNAVQLHCFSCFLEWMFFFRGPDPDSNHEPSYLRVEPNLPGRWCQRHLADLEW